MIRETRIPALFSPQLASLPNEDTLEYSLGNKGPRKLCVYKESVASTQLSGIGDSWFVSGDFQTYLVASSPNNGFVGQERFSSHVQTQAKQCPDPGKTIVSKRTCVLQHSGGWR